MAAPPRPREHDEQVEHDTEDPNMVQLGGVQGPAQPVAIEDLAEPPPAPALAAEDAGPSAAVQSDRMPSIRMQAGALEAALRARLAELQGSVDGGPASLVAAGSAGVASAVRDELGSDNVGRGGTATEAPASSPSGVRSPIPGVAYDDRPQVEGSEPIFGPDGTLDAADVLSRLTQYDSRSSTTNDASRCGPTALLAGAMMAKGKQGLLDYWNAVASKASEGGLGLQTSSELQAIKKRIEAGTATYDDLGALASAAFRVYAKNPEKGFSGMDVDRLADAAKIPSPPLQLGFIDPTADDGTSVAYHWVLMGTEKGKEFVYDPLPTPDAGTQLHFKSKDEEVAKELGGAKPYASYHARNVVNSLVTW